MAALVAALGILALNGAYWFVLRDPASLSWELLRVDPLLQRDAGVSAIALVLAFEAIRLMRSQRRLRDAAQEVERLNAGASAAADELQQSSQQLAEAQRAEKKLARELEQLREQLRTIETARKDAESRAQSAEQRSAGAREELVRSEIVHFLSLLQEKGRFVDFVMDDIAPYDDSQVGRAARVVHQGCAQIVREYFKLTPVHHGREGEQITVERDVDAGRYRLLGRVLGGPPFKGKLLHRGWAAEEVTLPRLVTEGKVARDLIVAPAEVEVN